MKIKKKLSWPYGEFSNIKSSNSNPMDDFENFFIAISILRENAAPFTERLAQFQYWSPLLYTHQALDSFFQLPPLPL